MKKLNINVKIFDTRIGTVFPFPEIISGDISGFFLRACIKKKIYIDINQTFLIPTGILLYIFKNNININIKSFFKCKNNKKIVLGNFYNFINFFNPGELKISFWNCSKKKICIKPGDKIAKVFIFSNKKIKFIYL
ncbi:hypothetical protein [Buchnera aphidicola]|uniref:Deoxyuridine 5'-triphosphate nucleotidohydrolase n=1 Tax=Buchnera aphidicola subsp. Cinara cedri (strain Cc) TaxID=372461 RepID=Q056Y1_BUCCC|nr:hypothetical protein [Buchnera aphidicola]ABJ90818.1 deoxyuridine 5'-triphosphate nucleotidohydrolase [Buchnera aphidicola BCc]